MDISPWVPYCMALAGLVITIYYWIKKAWEVLGDAWKTPKRIRRQHTMCDIKAVAKGARVALMRSKAPVLSGVLAGLVAISMIVTVPAGLDFLGFFLINVTFAWFPDAVTAYTLNLAYAFVMLLELVMLFELEAVAGAEVPETVPSDPEEALVHLMVRAVAGLCFCDATVFVSINAVFSTLRLAFLGFSWIRVRVELLENSCVLALGLVVAWLLDSSSRESVANLEPVVQPLLNLLEGRYDGGIVMLNDQMSIIQASPAFDALCQRSTSADQLGSFDSSPRMLTLGHFCPLSGSPSDTAVSSSLHRKFFEDLVVAASDQQTFSQRVTSLFGHGRSHIGARTGAHGVEKNVKLRFSPANQWSASLAMAHSVDSDCRRWYWVGVYDAQQLALEEEKPDDGALSQFTVDEVLSVTFDAFSAELTVVEVHHAANDDQGPKRLAGILSPHLIGNFRLWLKQTVDAVCQPGGWSPEKSRRLYGRVQGQSAGKTVQNYAKLSVDLPDPSTVEEGGPYLVRLFLVRCEPPREDDRCSRSAGTSRRSSQASSSRTGSTARTNSLASLPEESEAASPEHARHEDLERSAHAGQLGSESLNANHAMRDTQEVERDMEAGLLVAKGSGDQNEGQPQEATRCNADKGQESPTAEVARNDAPQSVSETRAVPERQPGHQLDQIHLDTVAHHLHTASAVADNGLQGTPLRPGPLLLGRTDVRNSGAGFKL